MAVDTPGEPGGAAGSQDALPLTSMVFGKSVVVAGATQRHLYAYDLGTHALRLISDLEGKGFDACSISPDRRTIAINTYGFRAEPQEPQSGPAAQMIWSISADGKTYKRLTPPGYQYKLDCGEPPHMYLDGRVMSDPIWTADSKVVVFGMRLSYRDSFIDTTGTVNVDADNYTVMATTANQCGSGSDCLANTPEAPHPSNGLFLARAERCDRSNPGLLEVSTGPVALKRPLVANKDLKSDQPAETWTMGQASRTHAWLRDGSGLLITVIPDKGYKNRVVRWTEATGAFKTVFTPDKQTQVITQVEVGPAGDVFIRLADKVGDAYVPSFKRLDLASGTATDIRPEDAAISIACF
jgi:hypothetical protein